MLSLNSRSISAGVVILLLLIVAWWIMMQTGVIGRATLAPPDGLNPLADRPEVLAYARSLEFNDAVPRAPDTTRLIVQVGDSLAFGPLAIIAAESRSHRNKESDLLDGRIVARIWLEDDYFKNDTLYYPAGTSYVWVDFAVPDDSLVTIGAQDSLIHPRTGEVVSRTYRNVGRWLIIPENPAVPVIQHGVSFTKHETGWRFNVAFADWRGDLADDPGWATCREHGCCSEE